MAEGGCRHSMCVTPDVLSSHEHAAHSRIRARHETCNARFKRFGMIQEAFRHSVHLHGVVFHAVSKIVELMIYHEEPLSS